MNDKDKETNLMFTIDRYRILNDMYVKDYLTLYNISVDLRILNYYMMVTRLDNCTCKGLRDSFSLLLEVLVGLSWEELEESVAEEVEPASS